MSDYQEYEKKCEQYRKENEKYLAVFEQDLKDAGLSKKTIRNHVNNADLYINDYLMYEDAYSMNEGCYQVGMFLGDWFIRKCMWSSPATVKSTGASLKKFYKSMLTHGLIEAEDYDELAETIKYGMEDWQEESRIYDDTDSFSW